MQLDGSSDDEDHKSPQADKEGSPQSAGPNSFFKMTYEQLLCCNKHGGDPRVYEAIKKQLNACLQQSHSQDEEAQKSKQDPVQQR